MWCNEEIEVPWKDQSTRKISACSNPSQGVPSHAGELLTRRQGHVDDAAEHYNYFFPDRGKGTANSAGFGWRGDGA